MTYYEEFGVPPSATPEEIRQAHRRLVKILHPDLQAEGAARSLAEIQTRRVNGICQTLLDPLLKKEYEDSLKTIHTPIQTKRNPWNTGLVLVASTVLLLLWQLNSDHTPTVKAQPSPERAAPEVPLTPPTLATSHAPVHSQPLTLPDENYKGSRAERPSENVADRIPDGRDRIPEATPSSSSAESTPAELNPAPAAPTLAVGARQPIQTTAPTPAPSTGEQKPESAASNPFAGTWVYVPEPITASDDKLYRPEYIEMRIRLIKGVLEGQYRARYHVPDRPLSPNVVFHFLGAPGNKTAELRWIGSNGVAGKLELKLMNANAVQADWKVTEMAEAADLISGTAILTRVQ